MVSAEISYHTPAIEAARPRLTLADCFVVLSVGLVATAVAAGLMTHFSVGLMVAAIVASLSFVAMMAGHIGVRRANRSDLDHYSDDKTELSDADATAAARHVLGDGAELQSNPATAEIGTKRQKDAEPDVARAINDTLLTARKAAEATANTADSVALQDLDLGNFRPRSPADLTTNPAKPAAADGESGSIDDMIRRLADDIESGRKSPDAAAKSQVAPSDTESKSLSFKETAEQLASKAPPELKPPPIPPASDAPKAPAPRFAPTMVEAATPPAASTNAPEAPPSATAKLAAIADALSDEHLEVCLETINHLEDYRAQHYEVTVRLQLNSGEVLDNDAFIAETRGTGLLPLLEAVKVSSTKRLAVQMMRRGRTGDFFSAVDGEALTDRQFSEDVDTIIGGDPALASRLVLAFSQADVRSLTPAQSFTLDSIAALGFRFSIEDISDLDMDFELLARRGFVFAKLDADVFLSGLPIGTTKVPAQDICQHLAKAGMSLIVGKIHDEAARAKIMGFGAVLGQGLLFGTPRPVRADVLRPGDQRPAASS